MAKRLISNVKVMHFANSDQAVEKTDWSARDYLNDPPRGTRKVKRGDWYSILVMEFAPGHSTALVSRHADEASASAAVGNNLKWMSDARYVGLALAHIM
jgi:hypothetical protein